MTETHARTMVKSLTYRAMAWVLTILLTWLTTGDLAAATGFSTLLHVVLSFEYYVHERILMKVWWGISDN
jgi:uncharacterized membrane protein